MTFHGHAKQGTRFDYSGVRGLNALLDTITTITTAPETVTQRLRKARAGHHGAKRLVGDAVKQARGCCRRALGVLVRMDSAFYGRPLRTLPVARGADVSVTVWLQHEANATPIDADLVLDATGRLLGVLAKLIRRQEHGEPRRCPRCDSYRVCEDMEQDEPNEGFWSGPTCASYGWNDHVFSTWQELYENTDIERINEYLERPGIASDRLHPPDASPK